MSLTDPSVGELLDRLSILKLKIAHGEELIKPIGHFRTEQTEILRRLPQGWQTTLDRQVTRLFEINELLWHGTDALRAAAKTNEVEVHARLGLSILRMNDERAQLIQAISEQHGDHRVEKM